MTGFRWKRKEMRREEEKGGEDEKSKPRKMRE